MSCRTVQRLKERIEIPCTVVAQPVDEQRGGSHHAGFATSRAIFFDARARLVRIDVTMESWHVQPKRDCVGRHFVAIQRWFLVVEPIMHLPKAALLTRCL